MKIGALVWNLLKYFLWGFFALFFGLFLWGAVKYGGSFGSYLHYLNQKDRAESFSQVHILSFGSYGHLFSSDDESLFGDVETMTGKESLISGEMDVFDPEFQEDFESFFDPDSLQEDDDNSIEELDDYLSGEYESIDKAGFVLE